MVIELLIALGASLFLNIVLFLIAFKFQTDKLTDASYAITFIVLACFGLFSGADVAKIVLVCMVTLWALRLGGFLLFRIWRTGVDHRFDGMRDNFFAFAKFWVAQGISVWVILLPALMALFSDTMVFTTLSFIGVIIWGAGLLTEAIADWQKYQFTQNPANKNKWIEIGIWRYSRHPNYFGEILVWIGVYLFVFSSLTPLQAVIGLASPLFIIILLLFVSGIPILEKSADKRWGKNKKYQEYKKQTSILVPLPRKSSKL